MTLTPAPKSNAIPMPIQLPLPTCQGPKVKRGKRHFGYLPSLCCQVSILEFGQRKAEGRNRPEPLTCLPMICRNTCTRYGQLPSPLVTSPMPSASPPIKMHSSPLSPVCSSLCSIQCLPQLCYCRGLCSCSRSAPSHKVKLLLRELRYHHHNASPWKSANGLVSHLHPVSPPHSPLHKHPILAKHYSLAPARRRSFQPYTFPPQTPSSSRSHSLAARTSARTAVPCCSRLQARHLVALVVWQASWPY